MALLSIRRACSLLSPTPSHLRTHLSTYPVLPLHLPSLISSWRALSSWRLEDGLQAVREKVGETKIAEVELGKKGRGYLHHEWQKIHMPFGLFLDAFILGLVPSSSPLSQLPVAYLAQSDLLDSTPSLLEDVSPLPHFYVAKEGSLYRRTIWIGPQGSFTPFHKDPYIGIYSQIVGNKIFHILPPNASPYLDLSPIPQHANTSQIPIPVSRILSQCSDDLHDLPLHILEKCRKKLTNAFDMPGACQVELSAGESLLIPEGWWHAAEGVEGPGIGVGAWFR
ncbi:hypothetical protein L204_103778 [Cryptococcus depauperatus]|nr:hypothetical protein L204_02935 [Cryptococcus depauperatus CBS 7855]